MTDTASTGRAAAIERASYPLWTFDTIRYNDLDRQNHVNNAVYATFLESGRVRYFRDEGMGMLAPDETMVLARLEIDFLAELHYPGTVEIGARILAVGRTSFRMGEAIFSGERCHATAELVMTLLDIGTRKAKPLTPRIREWLDQTIAMQR